MNETILVTGAAGFIGFHTARRLIEQGHRVVGIDNLSPYYDIGLKQARLDELRNSPHFKFQQLSIQNKGPVSELFNDTKFDRVVHLAGQAGVRAPPSDAHLYIESNLVGFCNIIDACRSHKVKHLVYASSSSVYGSEAVAPFSANDSVDHPQSLYAATKRANELLAHSYSFNYALPTSGLRFFTVYGPWGRPDMAVYKFTQSIHDGKEIPLYGDGELLRDFTYIDDIVDALLLVLDSPPSHGFEGTVTPASSVAPYQVFNIGNGRPESVNDLVQMIEEALGREANIRYEPAHPSDLHTTHADVGDLHQAFGIKPTTPLREGIQLFVDWFKVYNSRDASKR
jgi:UDP-glucuronate 4-epimerase